MDLIRLGEFGDGLGLFGGLQGDLGLEGGGVPLAFAGQDTPRDKSVRFDQYNILSCPVSGVHHILTLASLAFRSDIQRQRVACSPTTIS
jgi:hypothetical protein